MLVNDPDSRNISSLSEVTLFQYHIIGERRRRRKKTSSIIITVLSYYPITTKLKTKKKKDKTPINSVLFYSIKNKSAHHSPIAYTFYSSDDLDS